MFVDPNKVATETGHTRSTSIEWKKGSVDSMIGIMYIITSKDFLYNDFSIGGNGGSGNLGNGFLDFLLTMVEAVMVARELSCLVGDMVRNNFSKRK